MRMLCFCRFCLLNMYHASCEFNHVLILAYYPGGYELNKRTSHSTVVIKDSIYCWGGNQKNLPMVHDNEDKRQIASFVNIFHLPTFQWERKLTIGNPPSGMMFYACTNLEKNIFYFGGCCKADDCFHNNLYKLNSLTNEWEEIDSITPDNEPMRKRSCGMMSYSANRKDNLLLFGGFGPIPTIKQIQFQYVPLSNNPNLCYTNEVHIMCVSASPGINMVHIILIIVISYMFFRTMENTSYNRY